MGEGGPPFDLALVAFIALVDNPTPLGYEALVEIYRAAREEAFDHLSAFFLSSLDLRGAEAVRGRIPAAADGRPLTLGERKTLARRSTREQIARLMRDPDPTVLHELLRNPRLIERDVVELAARRPTTAQAQNAIASARRFATRHAVRRALVFNPYTPRELAARLCSLLSRAELEAVAAEPSVPPQVRDSARLLLTRRRGPTSRR